MPLLTVSNRGAIQRTLFVASERVVATSKLHMICQRPAPAGLKDRLAIVRGQPPDF
jgi:hypothetical protein